MRIIIISLETDEGINGYEYTLPGKQPITHVYLPQLMRETGSRCPQLKHTVRWQRSLEFEAHAYDAQKAFRSAPLSGDEADTMGSSSTSLINIALVIHVLVIPKAVFLYVVRCHNTHKANLKPLQRLQYSFII
jgi:hypothetical protein